MDENVFLGVIPVDKSITISDIEPFHSASDFSCNNFAGSFFLLLMVVRWYHVNIFRLMLICGRCHDGICRPMACTTMEYLGGKS